AFTLSKPSNDSAVGIYVDLSSEMAKKDALDNLFGEPSNNRRNSYIIRQASLQQIPGAPVSYWASNTARKCFVDLPKLADIGVEVKQGLGTTDDYRFVRLNWEVPTDNVGMGKTWTPYAKGGESND